MKHRVLVDRVCVRLFSLLRGLMFSSPEQILLVFSSERIISLHMWFVFFPIDVIYLSQDKRVVELVRSFKPFRCYRPHAKAQFVFEAPAGIIDSLGVRLGDRVEWVLRSRK